MKKQPDQKIKFKPGKDQPDFFSGAAGPKDLLAPSLVKEVKPGEKNYEGVATDYWVEVGGTIEPARYFRSFFAPLTTNTTWAGMLDALYLGDFGPGDCDTAIHVRPADTQRVLFEIGRKMSGIESDLMTETDRNKRSMLLTALRDLMAQQERLRVEVERLFFVSIQSTASSNNMVFFRRFCNSLVKRFAMKGIFLRGADTRQLEALLSMTPLDKEGAFKDTFRNMESSNIADLFPFGQGSINHKTGIVIGEDMQKKPLLYNGREKALGTGHICVVGRTGFGKTFMVLMLIARSALTGIRTVVIEPSREFKKGILGLGCPYIDFTADSHYRFNIFDVVESEDEDGGLVVELAETVQAVQAFVFKLVRLVDEKYLSGLAKTRIQELIWKLYSDRGIDGNPKNLYTRAQSTDSSFRLTRERKEMPALSDLYFEMARVPELKEIAEILKPFTRQGSNPSQAIFDCRSNVDFRKAPITGISVAGLEAEIMQPLAYFVIQKCAWERFGKADKNPTYIVMDEIQIPMEADVELARWIENGYRRGRHLNIWMITITQGFEVLLRNPYGLGVIKNSPTKIFLRQESLDIDAIQGKFALSNGEAAFLLRSPKGYGILKADTQSVAVHFKATQKDLELFANDPNKDFWERQDVTANA
ncbi:hypothetical protein DCCM_4599 [Desulfocucumis palustris]|uniref:Helicase HerA central domain-containing protein n=1 Tax=Desulfocucumis palustris TaxID=1898651 RepID=A0A2L2XH49_9FIRM|nr:hypothetical protein DCCM_4599 [Desulfocucumis palustris]